MEKTVSFVSVSDHGHCSVSPGLTEYYGFAAAHFSVNQIDVINICPEYMQDTRIQDLLNVDAPLFQQALKPILLKKAKVFAICRPCMCCGGFEMKFYMPNYRDPRNPLTKNVARQFKESCKRFHKKMKHFTF